MSRTTSASAGEITGGPAVAAGSTALVGAAVALALVMMIEPGGGEVGTCGLAGLAGGGGATSFWTARTGGSAGGTGITEGGSGSAARTYAGAAEAAIGTLLFARFSWQPTHKRPLTRPMVE